jgi:uncharacterized protein YutE (UPF0331/DUF86 family)
MDARTRSVQEQETKAHRLYALTQRVGFALWQLQELEGASAQYFVLVCQATAGMGEDLGRALVEKAKIKTFGATITQLAKAKRLEPDTQKRFQTLLAERNWLVHYSRADSRDAIHNENAFRAVVQRLDNIAEEAHQLVKNVGARAKAFVQDHGVSLAHIDELAAQTLKTWHGDASG